MEDEIYFKFTDNDNFFEMIKYCSMRYISGNKRAWLKIADYGLKYFNGKILRRCCQASEKLEKYIGRQCWSRSYPCWSFVPTDNFEMVKFYIDYRPCWGYVRHLTWKSFKSIEMIDLMRDHLKAWNIVKSNDIEWKDIMSPIFQYMLRYTADKENRIILSPSNKKPLIDEYGTVAENFIRDFCIDTTICKSFVFAENDVDGKIVLNGTTKFYANLVTCEIEADPIMETYNEGDVLLSALNFTRYMWDKNYDFGHGYSCDKSLENCKCFDGSNNYLDAFIKVMNVMKMKFPKFKIMYSQVNIYGHMKLYGSMGGELFAQGKLIGGINELNVFRKRFLNVMEEYHGAI